MLVVCFSVFIFFSNLSSALFYVAFLVQSIVCNHILPKPMFTLQRQLIPREFIKSFKSNASCCGGVLQLVSWKSRRICQNKMILRKYARKLVWFKYMYFRSIFVIFPYSFYKKRYILKRKKIVWFLFSFFSPAFQNVQIKQVDGGDLLAFYTNIHRKSTEMCLFKYICRYIFILVEKKQNLQK